MGKGIDQLKTSLTTTWKIRLNLNKCRKTPPLNAEDHWPIRLLERSYINVNALHFLHVFFLRPCTMYHIHGNGLFSDCFEESFFFCKRGDTVQHHSGLRSRELGQAPMLQVCLIGTMVYYQPSYNTSHNEIQWPTAARQCHFALRDVSCRQSWHVLSPSDPRVPPE